jgi:hypothetical protein
MVIRVVFLLVLANVFSKSFARTPIDTSKIILTQYWQTMNYNWFGDDTIVLKSITKRQLDRKPTSGKHQKSFDYFYFDSSGNVKYTCQIPGGCGVGMPVRSLTGFRRNANRITVDFANHMHQVKPKGPFIDYDGPMLYEIIELKHHRILLVKRKS